MGREFGADVGQKAALCLGRCGNISIEVGIKTVDSVKERGSVGDDDALLRFQGADEGTSDGPAFQTSIERDIRLGMLIPRDTSRPDAMAFDFLTVNAA